MATDDTQESPVEGPDGRSERFPFADEVDVPEELDGWEEMYTEFFLYNQSEDRTDYERDQFWFYDKNHSNRPLRPWELTTLVRAWQIGIGQNPSRVFAIPPAMSVEIRTFAGYLYWTAHPVEDQDLLEERGGVFAERSEYVYENYDGLFEAKWKPEVKRLGREVMDLEVPQELPRYAPEETIIEAKGQSQDTLAIVNNYDRLTDLALEGYQRHFEYLHLAYLAYLTFRETCEEFFPGISEDVIGKMVSGIQPDLFRPDLELTELAELAVSLGDDVTTVLKSDDGPSEKLARLDETEAGREFKEAFDEAKDPWFHISYGDGNHSVDNSWIDDLEAPFDHLQTKIERLEAGEEIGRNFEQVESERKELVDEYRSYLDSDEERERFDQAYATCKEIYEYTEDHQFWIEHWLTTKIFDKMREFGQLLVNEDVLDDPDDIFLFTEHQVKELLEELCKTWGLGPDGYVPSRWKAKAQKRRQIMDAAREWNPPPAMGIPPEEVSDPLVIMLWGITTDKVDNWLDLEGSDEEVDSLEGFASSKGAVEGTARVLSTTEELDEIEEDDILVAPYTNPAWAPVFPQIAGAVTDDGGITSHAAIVCREYGVPAVTGTGQATQQIETGDYIRVDGNEGTVEILERN
ncbi:PEP-utilizing enzyme [Halobellus rufus]|uniref:PEP-utilizing enzyme n=1 Tax=Halobellus rufus TaxID=1448860 RepID=UPI0009DD12CB|nr:PEP-utilizing enzyme [Halobellus rufus]